MSWDVVARHHEAQKLIARNAVAELHPLWGILRFHELDASTADWLKAARPVVEKGYLVSQYTAAQFVQEYRRTQFPNAAPLDLDMPNPLGFIGLPHPAPRDVQVRIMVSLKVTGPVWVKKNMPGEEQPLMDGGFSKSTGAATRLILNGGRGMVRLLADADTFSVGVAGVTDDDACPDCQFLQNPIMKTDGARKMDAVAVGHDYCKCSARLVY